MGDTQERLTKEIKRVSKKYKLDADFEYNYSNTGRMYFRKGFKTLANMSFDFQTEYSTFAFKRGDSKAEYYGNNDKLWNLHYEQSDSVETFLKELEYLLKSLV